MGDMNSADDALGQFIGRQAGTAMAGNAPITVDDAQLKRLGDQVPAGARVDACADRLVFSTTSVSFSIEAAPPDNPDMTFRLAGMVDPTVVVPGGAKVSIEFVNGDSDEANAFVITTTAPPYGFRPAATPAFGGSAAGPVGDPTPAGHSARDMSFTAGSPGTFYYLCPMPGHAEMGMTGRFIVR
jgi:rusticyanin